MNTNMEKQNVILRRILIGIGVVMLALIIFKVGMFVGYKKASYSYNLGENYYRTFGGQRLDSRRGMMGGLFGDNMMASGHGVTGKVIKISLPNIIVEGNDNIEKTIVTNNQTLIRNMRNEGTMNDIKVNDTVIIIGSPDESGEVVAKLIRIVMADDSINNGSTNK